MESIDRGRFVELPDPGVCRELHVALTAGAAVWVSPSGSAETLFRAAARYPRARWTGIDVEVTAIGGARRRLRRAGLPNLAFILAAPRSIPIEVDWLLWEAAPRSATDPPPEIVDSLIDAGWRRSDAHHRAALGALSLAREGATLTLASVAHLVPLLGPI